MAEITGARLIRLQCYEGLDEGKALYEWNYRKQLLRIQAGGEMITRRDLTDEGPLQKHYFGGLSLWRSAISFSQ